MKKLIITILILMTILTSCIFQPEEEKLDLKIEFKNDSINLTWNQISSVERYELYKRNKNEENYKLLKNINSNETTSYVDYDFDPHQTYIYQMTYYKRNYISQPVEKVIEIPNRLPNKVIPTYPFQGSTDVDPGNFKIIWNEPQDKDNDALEYTISIKDNGIPVLLDKTAETSYSFNNLKHSKEYVLRIDVFDGYGTTIGEEIAFKTKDPDTTLEKPILKVSSVSTETITLEWQNIERASYYIIYRKIEGEENYSVIKKTTSTEYTDINLQRKTQYTYKVKAFRESNNDIVEVSEYSNEISATTINNSPEFLNEEFNPTNNATDIDLNIKVSWKAKDIDGDKIYYDLYFGEDEAMVNNKDNSVKVLSSTENTQYDPTLYIKKVYFWKVIAKDEYGDSAESETYKFTTKNIENNKPVLNIPDQNMSENSTLTLNLKNMASDEDGDELTFILISGSGTIITTEDATNYVYYADYESSGTHEVVIGVTDTKEMTKTKFNIIVENANRPPEKPLIEYPRKNSQKIPISNLKLEWSCKDPDNDENITYSIYLSSSKTKVENNSEDVLLVKNYSQTNYVLEFTLDYLTTYYWKIEAKDSSGATSVGDIGSFVTEEKPAIIEISDVNLNVDETGFATIATKELYSVNGLKNIEVLYDPQYIDVYITEDSSGIEFIRDDIKVFFDDVEFKNYSADKKSIIINIAFSPETNVTVLKGDILKIYFKAKKSGKSTLSFKNAEGVRLLDKDKTESIKFDYSDTGDVIVN